MLKNIGTESVIQKTSETQPRLATSFVGWIQTALIRVFGGLGKARGERRMELIETLQLGGKRQLMLVICDGQRYLIGAGSESIHSIAEVSRQQPSSTWPSVVSGDAPAVRPEILSPHAQCSVGWSQ